MSTMTDQPPTEPGPEADAWWAVKVMGRHFCSPQRNRYGQQAVGAFCTEHSDALKNLSDRLAEREETEGGRA